MTTLNVDLLKRYALDNYDLGGHWVAECWSTDDYVQVLYDCKNDLEEAKLELRAYWTRVNEQQAECRWE